MQLFHFNFNAQVLALINVTWRFNSVKSSPSGIFKRSCLHFPAYDYSNPESTF